VVHATGGLDDTVNEWDPATQTGSGFKYANQTPEDFYAALERALDVFRNDKESWTRIMRNGMAKSYTWDKPAKEYVEVYRQVARRRS